MVLFLVVVFESKNKPKALVRYVVFFLAICGAFPSCILIDIQPALKYGILDYKIPHKSKYG